MKFTITINTNNDAYSDNVHVELMENLNQLGTTIYLERTPKELFQRVKQATNSRPLIAHKTDEELLEYIESTMEKRREIYLKSKIIADRFSQTPEKLIALIQK